MITKIKINGFKSLINTELYFGPFTCIVGANATGKSNFFDALSFLSNLADKTIVEAAKSVRSENLKHSSIKDIFFHSGEDCKSIISFEVDLLISKNGIDDLGQTAEATITSLKYSLQLELCDNQSDNQPIKIIYEQLSPITLTEARKNLFFKHKKEWRESILSGRRSNVPFISTKNGKIKLHQDGNKKGRAAEFIADTMPRTLLSTATAESPTAFLVRQEMRNWMMLQFEPEALRKPNYTYEVRNAEIEANGLNLPATLYRLHTEKKDYDIYQTLTNKVNNLIHNVREITIDEDEKRDLLTLQVTFKDGLTLPAQSLSDGTLRFLGLAVIEEDTTGSSVVCLEEPENGINPKKICEMVDLLENMATDTDEPVDHDNPLRQVIINTHSPIVASHIPDDTLYLVTEREMFDDTFSKKITFSAFSALSGTWRTDKKLVETTSLGEIIAYLDGTTNMQQSKNKTIINPSTTKQVRTVAENIRLQTKLNFDFE